LKQPATVPAVRRVQVLQVALTLAPGGTERLVVEMSRHLRAEHGMAVCCLDEPGAWAEDLRREGTEVVALGRQPGFSPSLGRRIAAVASRVEADVVHCHHYSPFVYGMLARLWRPRLRVVFTEHGRADDGPPSSKRRHVNRILARFPSHTYSVSEDLKRHMVAEGFPAGRVQVIRNGIAIGRAASPADRWEARRRLRSPADQFLIGAVGRLDRVKDLHTLLRAFRDFAASEPRARLVLVGEGPERTAIERGILDAGLDGRVTVTGYRADVRELLPAFDVYVSTSIFEGISLTILEAMAAGLPVVATCVGGTPEVVIDGTTGWLVPPRQPQAVAGAFQRCAADVHRMRVMGAEGRQRVTRQFSLDRMVEAYRGVYESLEGC
jgi:L-malate glycosyltransferase